ncbi:hypothetical protein Bbelb_298500 [Branchiostoma belcheri]|nr:hypothetical protein Bbelb_298500 [Branchiostoma belcheri]
MFEALLLWNNLKDGVPFSSRRFLLDCLRPLLVFPSAVRHCSEGSVEKLIPSTPPAFPGIDAPLINLVNFPRTSRGGRGCGGALGFTPPPGFPGDYGRAAGLYSRQLERFVPRNNS